MTQKHLFSNLQKFRPCTLMTQDIVYYDARSNRFVEMRTGKFIKVNRQWCNKEFCEIYQGCPF